MAKLNAEQRRAMLASLAAKRKTAGIDPRTARPTKKTSQEDYTETKEVTETETKDVDDDDKEAKRFARRLKRRACKIAQDEHSEEIETIVEDEEDEAADDVADSIADEAVEAIIEAIPEAAELPAEELAEVIEDAVEDAVMAAIRRSAAKKKLARRARVASRGKTAAADISDDLVSDVAEAPALPQKDTATEVAVSDDLEEKSITPDGTTKDNGQGVKPPASVSAAKEQFIAALDLVKTEKAAGVLAPEAREAAVCESYASKYTVEAMKLATEKLRAVGSAQRVAGAAPSRHVVANSARKTASVSRSELGALY